MAEGCDHSAQTLALSLYLEHLVPSLTYTA